MLNQDQIMDIKILKRQGHSIKSIVRLTGHSRNTVRKMLAGPLPAAPRKPKKSLLDDFKDFAELKFQQGCPAERILTDLKAMGYSGGKSQLYRLLKPLRQDEQFKAKLTVRFETGPGEQAQVDWGHFGNFIDEQGVKRNLYLFAYVLGYSRTCYIEFVTSMDLATLVRCHLNAFDALGGVPQTILYDNMKTVRLSPQKLNPAFVDFANYYGFNVKTCRPYRARTKGKVERLIRYVRTNFIPQRVFSSLSDANAGAKNWMDTVANVRVHATTGMRPCDLLPQEVLTNISTLPAYRVATRVNRRANFEGYVHHQGNRYSVPAEAAGKIVEVESCGSTIRVYLKSSVITEHPQAIGKGKIIAIKEHVEQMWKKSLGDKAQPPSSQSLIQSNEDVQVADLHNYEMVSGQ